MRSALLQIPGVTRVQASLVSLQDGDAVVTYDPRTTKVESLIEAVNAADGPLAVRPYRATVKEGPRPASAP